MSFPNGAPSEATVHALTEAYAAGGVPGDFVKVAVDHVIDVGDPGALPFEVLTDKVAEDTGLDLAAERGRRMQQVLARINSPDQFGILL